MIVFDSATVRAAFEAASDTFRSAVSAVPESLWDRSSGCGTWTVRQLVAHGMRAYRLLQAWIPAPPETDVLLADVADYYAAAMRGSDVHTAITARGVADAVALDDPVGELEVLAPAVLALVASTGDDDPFATRFGQIPLIQYLASRVVELGLHAVDVQKAIGAPVEIHPTVAEVCLHVLTNLGHGQTIVLALSGRGQLPDGFNVLS